MTKVLYGEPVRDEIAKELTLQIKDLQGLRPKLVIIQVGDIPESGIYIKRKKLFGQKIGALVDHAQVSSDISQQKLVDTVKKLNSDASIHGIIVQLPISKHLNKDEIIETIDQVKDVDGLTSRNLKLLWEDSKDGHVGATTKGILALLEYYEIEVTGKNVVIVGRSTLVGKPTALAFLNKDATVSVCHSKTENLADFTKSADIIISAAGKPGLITTDHVKKEQVVVDVGTTVVDGKLKGDVDFENVKDIVAAISPVPGGIGPLTVASLFENLLNAYGDTQG